MRSPVNMRVSGAHPQSYKARLVIGESRDMHFVSSLKCPGALTPVVFSPGRTQGGPEWVSHSIDAQASSLECLVSIRCCLVLHVVVEHVILAFQR